MSTLVPCADILERLEGNTVMIAMARSLMDTAESENLGMVGNFKHENRETP